MHVTVEFNIDGQECMHVDDMQHIVAHSKDCYHAKFNFKEGSPWLNVARTARFVNATTKYFEDVALDEMNMCSIPDTILQPGLLKVGLFGGDMIPTKMGYVRVRESVISDTTPEPPKPDIYQQLLQMVQQANNTATQALTISQEVMNKSDSYTFIQQTDSDFWYIEHGLNQHPSVAAYDTEMNMLFGVVEYPDNNTVTIRFSQPISGTAVLS